ncbi:hypothetical protein Peur_070396 [Populus x canadensis]
MDLCVSFILVSLLTISQSQPASHTIILNDIEAAITDNRKRCHFSWLFVLLIGKGRLCQVAVRVVQKSSACLTMGFVTTICTDLARKLISQDELEETRKAIRDCQTAGVNVKFISQDDISVVRAAAIEFGILTENSEAAMLKGEDFRNFSEEERIGMVDPITAIGNVVALTGANDLNDTPALRQADIGFVKADWGTKMTRDYLDLMLWDGTWSPVPNIIK